MSEMDVADLANQVLALAFALGLAFGAVAQRSHFCTMGALADLVGMGDTTRLRIWAMAAGVAVLGFNTMVALGWVKASDTIHAEPVLLWLSMGVGGLLFGGGMVLASGCGSKSLVRVGGGNLKSLVVLLVMGLSAWATMRGVTALLRVQWLDAQGLTLGGPQDLPSLLAGTVGGLGVQPWALLAGGAAGLGLLAWSLATAEARRGAALLGGLGIGACTVALWWVTGVLGHVPEHPATLEPVFLGSASRRMESFTFVAPVAYLMEYVVFASDTSRRLFIGSAAAFGVVLGSAAMALATRSFRWEGFTRVDDLARHLVGAVLMGVGGVTALGCTIGQGLTGVSTLSLGSLLATASILAGGWGMLRYELWRLERQA